MPASSPTTPRRTWLMPVVLIVALAVILPSVYLSATADPQEHLADLPVAVVIEPQSQRLAGAPSGLMGDAILEHTGPVRFAAMTGDELEAAMAVDRVAGAVVIPADFDASISSLFPGTRPVVVPEIAVLVNAGDGGLSNGLVAANVTPLLDDAAKRMGDALVDSVQGHLPAANHALLSDPVDVSVRPYAPLPAHSGLGTSAFYFALVLVLIAFIGASLTNPLVDAALGVIPSELGPLVARRPYAAISRTRTLLTKVAILFAAAPVASAALIAIAGGLGVAAPSWLALWAFSTTVIAAIGTSALAVFAVLGPGIGSLVNTLFFVALAMVSSGGIVPLEATPGFIRFVSLISPFRYAIDGIRSLMYFDGNLAAGLGDAWVTVVIGGLAGLLFGVCVTTLYGRVARFSRHPRVVV
ncbi:ABC transporter permease [Microbacterium insulae]|uniref:ABC transporter permease n=1 Tax=Microbacterium insulae TaxID=483014 RepID=A0ABW3AIH9_9MICO